LTRAAVGGAAASAAGGKFANGAFTAAFNYLLNDSNPAHENSDPDMLEAAGRVSAKAAWAAKKTGEVASVTGDVIEEGYKEVAIGKGIGVAGVVVKEVGLIARFKSFLGFGSQYEKMVKAAQKAYPDKAGKFELHHVSPKYLGGAADGPVVSIDAAYHQQITNAFRAEWEYGIGKPSAAQLEVIKSKVYSQYPLPK
jgi:hypothetical protein